MMKNLDYYVRMNLKTVDNNTYLSLIQRDVSGGRISKQQIDGIKQFPHVTEISISGLTQDKFDYFVENYAHQFKAIRFWKCPLVGDLKKIEWLDKVEYIVFFWNQRAENFWDFSKMKSLKGLCFEDFTRMHDISEISGSRSLEELQFGNKVWVTYVLNTLDPIKRCSSLKSLTFSARKIVDQKIEPIAQMQALERLSFPTRLFSTEQVAWLKAHLPDTVESKMLNAYWTRETPISIHGKNKDTFIVGKRKPFLDSVQDQKRIAKYVQQFSEMVQWYLEYPAASPDDYKRAA